MAEFPAFTRKAREILGSGRETPGPEDYRELLCGDCPFYHHGEEENEECGSFRLLVSLLEKGALDLRAALEELGSG